MSFYSRPFGYGGYGYGAGSQGRRMASNRLQQQPVWESSPSRLRNGDYTGPIVQIRRSTDSATLDLMPTLPNGGHDPAVIRAFNGWNLLAFSEQLATSPWGALFFGVASAPIATNNAGVAPDGTNTATRVQFDCVDTSSGGNRSILRQNVPVVSGTNYCGSIWVKAFDAGSVGKTVRFIPEGIGTGVVHSLTSQWSLVTISGVSAVTSSPFVIETRGTVTTQTADCLLWGAQFEVGSTRSTYEPRTTTGAGSSFIVTEYNQRSNGRNLLNKSEDFVNSAWGNSVSGTGVAPVLTPNAGAPPTGIGALTATRMQFDLGGGTASGDITRRIQSYTPANGVDYTYSIWIRSYDGASSYNMHIVGATGATTNIAVTGSWQRFTITGTGTGINAAIGLGLRGAQSPANSNTADVLVTAAQLELGDTATAYDRRLAFGAGQGHATQGTTTLQPIICNQGVVVTENNRPVGQYVAADARRLVVANSTNMFNELHTTGGAVALVSKANDTAAVKLILSSASTSTGAGIRISRGSNEVYGVLSGRLNVAGVATAGWSIEVNHAGSASTSNTVLISQADPDNGTAASRALSWGNGTALSTANAQTGTPFVENASDNMTIGATAAGGSSHDGTIGDKALFLDLISQEDRVALADDMGAYYGITITQPVSITTHPSNALGWSGDTVSFSVVAANASDYAWQVSTDGGTTWQPTGSNSSTINVLLSTGMNGYRYRVLAGNRAGSVVSNVAVLTVEAGVFDNLPSVELASAVGRRLLTSYNDKVATIRRSTDSATLDLYRSGTTGYVDPNVVREWNGWNLLAYTDAIDTIGTPGWGRQNVNVTANAETSPLTGLSTADLVIATTATGRHVVNYRDPSSGVFPGAYTFSVYAKAGGYNFLAMSVMKSSNSLGVFYTFDLTNGSISQRVTSAYSGFTATATDAGGGWWRCRLTWTNPPEHVCNWFNLGPSPTGDPALDSGYVTASFTGDNASGVYLAGAQLESGGTLTTYEPRTTTGAGSSFLVTLYNQLPDVGVNILSNPSNLDNAVWQKIRSSVTEDAATGPFANTFGDLFIYNTENGTHHLRQVGPFTPGPSTLSIYAKASGETQFSLWLDNGNLGGTFTLTGSGTATPSNAAIATRIIPVADGWYRCAIYWSGSTATDVRIYGRNGGAFIGDGVSGVLLYGAKLESGIAPYMKDFTQATTTLQPIVCESGVPVTEGGRLSAKYVAADFRRMSIPSSTTFFNALHTTGGVIGVVAKANDTAGIKTIMANKENTNQHGVVLLLTAAELLQANAGRRDVAGVATDGLTTQMSGAFGVTNNVSVTQLDPDNATASERCTQWLNGNVQAKTNVETSTPFVENARNNMTIGSVNSGSNAFDGTISEVAIWSTFLSEAQRKAVEANQGSAYTIAVTP